MEAYKPKRMRKSNIFKNEISRSGERYKPQVMNESNNSVMDLLKQLAELQLINEILTAKMFIEQGKIKTEEKVSALKESILSIAKAYGQKRDKVMKEYELYSTKRNTIIGDYQELFDNINQKYEGAMKNILTELNEYEQAEAEFIAIQDYYQDRLNDIKSTDGYKEYFENEFLNSDEYKQYVEDLENYDKEYEKYIQRQVILKEEINIANEEGDMETVEMKAKERENMKMPIEPIMPIPEKKYKPANFYYSKIEPARGKIKKLGEIIDICINEYDKIYDARDDEINRLEISTENKIQDLAKNYTPIQRFIFGFLNRINGAKKFKDNVIEKINLGIDNFKAEKLPKIEDEISKRVVEFSTNIAKRKEEFIQDLEEDKEFTSNVFEGIKGKTTNFAVSLKDIAGNSVQKLGEKIQLVREFAASGAEEIAKKVKDTKELVINSAENVGEKIGNIKENAILGANNAKDSLVGGVARASEDLVIKANTTVGDIENKIINRAKQTFNIIIINGRNTKIDMLQKLNSKIQYNINEGKNNSLKNKMEKDNQGQDKGEIN